MRQKVHSASWRVLLPLLFTCAACSGGPLAAAATSDPVPGVTFNPDLVRRGDFRSILLLTGELGARFGEDILVPRLPAWETTIRWMADDGTFVAEGDRLVELDTAQIASELENKITLYQQAFNQLAGKQAEVAGQIARKEFEVAKTRVALRKAAIDAQVPEDLQTRKTYQETQLALEQARVGFDKATADLDGYHRSSGAEIEAARIDVASAEREVQEARRAIETMVLRTPQGGIAVAAENRREGRKFQVGDTAWVGAKVMEIPDLSEMQVQARLSDVDDGKIAEGMRISATLDAYPERRYAGTIRNISPVAQEAGRRSMQRYFAVLIDLDETDPEIMRPGMSVKVEVETARRHDVVLAPRAALEFGDEAVFLVLADGRRTEVMLGPCGALECVIEEGASEGVAVGVSR